ncbi:MAG: methylated-DNA--[protein]-cysteine S-methyltransferase [Acidimicrobiales bacterium]
MTYRIAVESPVGALTIEGSEDAVTHIGLPDGAPSKARRECSSVLEAPGPLIAAAAQLTKYFAGERLEFELPLELAGTSFQRQVWLALAEIPYGRTISYAELARMVGRPAAFRAVGQANGANPVPIVLPCHRVVASGGGIGGYGGGLTMKRRLLALEGVTEVG